MLHDGMYMTNDEFLSDFQLDRACIHQLNELVKNDEAFSNCWGKQNKQQSMLHIMVLLKYLGSYGNEASFQKIGRDMGVSKGTVNCVMWESSAILKLQKKILKWPDGEERKQISARIKQAHGFVNCVGLIDGALFPLAFAPTLNTEDYFMRKGNYVIKVCLFVMILQRLLGLRWDGLAAYTTIGYGQSVMFTCQRKSISATRSICLMIRHFLHPRLWFLL